MNKQIIYNELVRQFKEGNKADNIVNKKVDYLLLLSNIFIGYFFTNDSFLNIFKNGNVLIKHIFCSGVICLIISFIFTIKSFLIARTRRGIKIDKIQKIIEKHKNITELDILNFSLKKSIQYNYNKQKNKNRDFIIGLSFIMISIILFIISKVLIF